jgi:hypothetical protein
MLYKLTKKIKGQVITDCIDTLSVVNRRKKALTASYRGQGVILEVTPADDTDEKYQKPLTDRSWAGGDYHRNKQKVKAKIKATKRKNK